MILKINKFGQGFPLVFFHGWGFDSQIWQPLVPHLMDHYQLILVDLPGFGYSSIMDWDLFKDNLLSQLPEKFALIGWSMGGLYALRLAIEESARIAYLVAISSSPRFLVDPSWPGVSREVFAQFYQKLMDNPHAILKEFMDLHGVPGTEKSILPERPPSQEGLECGLKILETWDFREELKHFNKPSCFMFGRLDPIVPVKTLHSMRSIYPDFNYVFFKRAAHMPFLSHLDLFTEEIRGFIQ